MDIPYLSRQQAIVFDALDEAGPRGCTNVKLNELMFRYGARIMELRRLGFVIDTKRAGTWERTYILRRRPWDPTQPAPAKPAAKDGQGELLEIIQTGDATLMRPAS